MIIFDLDGTLADCEHRRHFVDPNKNENLAEGWVSGYEGLCFFDVRTNKRWVPNWKKFYESCDKDEPIQSVIEIFKTLYLNNSIMGNPDKIQIWSGRCESVRKKTLMWLDYNINPTFNFFNKLKMRPIGDNTPDDQLKERWLDEYLNLPSLDIENSNKIEMVFDDRPKVIRMWRRREIFVFDCNQDGKEF